MRSIPGSISVVLLCCYRVLPAAGQDGHPGEGDHSFKFETSRWTGTYPLMLDRLPARCPENCFWQTAFHLNLLNPHAWKAERNTVCVFCYPGTFLGSHSHGEASSFANRCSNYVGISAVPKKKATELVGPMASMKNLVRSCTTPSSHGSECSKALSISIVGTVS